LVSPLDWVGVACHLGAATVVVITLSPQVAGVMRRLDYDDWSSEKGRV
jgi:hypothetical protein